MAWKTFELHWRLAVWIWRSLEQHSSRRLNKVPDTPCQMGTSKLEWNRSPDFFSALDTLTLLHGQFQFWLENGILQHARWRERKKKKQHLAASVMQHCIGKAVTSHLPAESTAIQRLCIVATSVTHGLCGFWSLLGKCFSTKTKDFFDAGGGLQPWSWIKTGGRECEKRHRQWDHFCLHGWLTVVRWERKNTIL